MSFWPQPICCCHSLVLASANLLLSQFGSGLSQLCLSDGPQLGCQFSILCFCSWLGDFAVLQVGARLAIELWCCGCIYCCCSPLHSTWIVNVLVNRWVLWSSVCKDTLLSLPPTQHLNCQCPCQQVRIMVQGLQRYTAVTHHLELSMSLSMS